MHRWIGSALAQIMTCRLFGAKPLSKPMLCYCQLAPSKKKLQWNLDQNTKSFIHEHASEHIVCEKQPFCPGGDESSQWWLTHGPILIHIRFTYSITDSFLWNIFAADIITTRRMFTSAITHLSMGKGITDNRYAINKNRCMPGAPFTNTVSLKSYIRAWMINYINCFKQDIITH